MRTGEQINSLVEVLSHLLTVTRVMCLAPSIPGLSSSLHGPEAPETAVRL